MMTLYPAIDVLGGKCVRLYRGDYERSTVYDESPLDAARYFYQQGARWIHVVDLDGARVGRPVNRDLIVRIAAEVPVSVEVGGGIRTMETMKDYLSGGVRRVILGSAAISDPVFTRLAIHRFQGAIGIGLDVKQGKVAISGWRDVSDMRAEELAKALIAEGADHFIYTDISRDGALGGANRAGALRLSRAIGMPLVISGGITDVAELRHLAACPEIGGAIIGKALYTGKINLRDAIKAVETDAGQTNHPLS